MCSIRSLVFKLQLYANQYLVRCLVCINIEIAMFYVCSEVLAYF